MHTPSPDSATTTTDRVGRGRYSRLSPKLQEDVVRRVVRLSLLMAGVIVVVEFFQQLAQPQLASVLQDPINRLTTLGAVLLALGLYALWRYKIVTASTMLVLGMVFEVVVAFSISMIETAVPFRRNEPLLGISSLGPWIVLVGVVIPNRPVWTLVTALAAATTWPLAFAINATRYHFELPPWGLLIVWPTMNYLLAVLAYGVGRHTYGCECEAQTAQDLGSYRLVSPIGHGGMGEVWKATHQMLARPAAIKLVRPEMIAGSSARQADLVVKRFRREANAIAGLQSPHTVYLLDFGYSKAGQLYYVMELLDGINLQTLVTSFGPQPAARVRVILGQVCESLDEAHQQGLVHRDLKPSNIMLCKVALAYDFVKVLDFGLAKQVGLPDASQLTMEGSATGTPAYMAPEVAMGEAGVDGRADTYALGCVGYFLLTGSLVFPDPNPMTMALKHVQAKPDRPSQRTELPIPHDLERIVMQCLEKKPADRPVSTKEMADMLAGCDVPEWTDNDATDWWGRNLPPTSSLRSFAQVAVGTPPVVQKI